jgi:hypothetical protein
MHPSESQVYAPADRASIKQEKFSSPDRSIWSRNWYCRRRARTGALRALTRVFTRAERSRTVIFPSNSIAALTTDESAP